MGRRGGRYQPPRLVARRLAHPECEIVPALLRVLKLGELVEPSGVAGEAAALIWRIVGEYRGPAAVRPIGFRIVRYFMSADYRNPAVPSTHRQNLLRLEYEGCFVPKATK